MLGLMVNFSVKPGNEEKARQYMRSLEGPSRREPGCRLYIAHQAEDDPCRFAFYEQYDNHAALEAHRATEHFKQFGTNGLFPLMENREIKFYNTLD